MWYGKVLKDDLVSRISVLQQVFAVINIIIDLTRSVRCIFLGVFLH